MGNLIEFGTTETTDIIDDEGSTLTVVEHIANFEVTRPRRKRFAIRHRADKTDVEKIGRISQSLINDPNKLDTELKLERTKTGESQGYYTIVECWTVLEY